MKKITFFLLFLLGGKMLTAQSIDEIQKFALLNQFDKAKEAVDKFLAQEKNAKNAEAWYYKGVIYNNLSKEEKYAALCTTDCKMEAFTAFQKYKELDTKVKMLKDESYGSLFDLYNGYFDKGAGMFNTKDYKGAFDDFGKALEISDYINKNGYDYNGFKFPELDTSLVLNLAVSARLAKQNDDAATYYAKLANANLGAPQYLEVYEYLVDYYERKKEYEQMQKYVDMGKALYPNESFWLEVEMGALSRETDPDKMFAKYDELFKKYPDNYLVAYNYAVEIYNALHTGDKKPGNPDALREKLNDVLKVAIAKDTTPNSNVLMARHLYIDAADFDDAAKAIKSTKSEDVKKKSELKGKFMESMNKSIPYAEAAIAYFSTQSSLKASQKTNYKSMLDYLSQIYLAKGDSKKSAEYDRKRTEVDKL